MSQLVINGVMLNVEVAGQGPALVALHGFTGSASTWRPLAQAVDQEYAVVAIDILGHGASAKPIEPLRYAMERTAEDMLGVLDALGIAAAHWLGYSMGGRIALSLALAAPERCNSLVLESASPGVADADERTERVASDESLAVALERDGIKAFVDYWESLPLWASQARLPEDVWLALRAQRLANDPVGLAGSLRGAGSGAQPYVGDALASLAMPVCFITGEDDAKYTDLAQSMAGTVQDGRAVVVPKAGHAVHLEQPDIFHATVREFLNAHSPAQAH
jgi:2-succinyl-6-hydroxy-2,4-cyclohexadiene-1-carboxylate synthase